uniref:Uncharacterized protein n=1 Tax=Physcomitrium patens TaxID=3218 RepID=A0A2K1KMN1_PHYPA|nr:hypothetical protein PHYPA_005932 [Physcomitrium patens]
MKVEILGQFWCITSNKRGEINHIYHVIDFSMHVFCMAENVINDCKGAKGRESISIY